MKNYLPIGTVVLLKNANKKIMIYGRRQLMESSGVMYDYVACLYPEGNISSEYTFLFNEDDILQVVFKGYEDKENEEFVNEVLNKIDRKV